MSVNVFFLYLRNKIKSLKSDFHLGSLFFFNIKNIFKVHQGSGVAKIFMAVSTSALLSLYHSAKKNSGNYNINTVTVK